MNEELERQWERYRRSGLPFAVLLVDIDHFKLVNDSHGHAAGDRVLAHVARVLHTHARATDCVARMGGEEFLVLLPDMNAADALRLAQRLRQSVEEQPVQSARHALHTTVSIGVAIVRSGDAGVDPVVGRADAALYRAKAAGRNRCEPAAGDGSAESDWGLSAFA